MTRRESAVPDERDLMRMHIDALFTHDAAGRMIRVNEPGGKIAPRFFLGRTRRGNVWRFRHDLDAELVRALEAECARESADDEYLDSPYGATSYEALLARTATVQRLWAGPAYRFPTDLGAATDTIEVTTDTLDVLRPLFADWLGDVPHCQPFVALVQDGRAVSVCASVRTTATADEAGVETHRDLRGRGYAPRVVSAWARAVRAAGRVPLYSTSWENRASQAVAAKLELVRFGADVHIT